MPLGLCHTPATFQRYMLSIFTNFVGKCIKVFMVDFTVYDNDFETCVINLELILNRCIDINLVLNFEK